MKKKVKNKKKHYTKQINKILLVNWPTNSNLVIIIEKDLNETIVGRVGLSAHKERRLDRTVVWILKDRIENALEILGVLGREHAVERERDHHGRVVVVHVVGDLGVGAFA